jgi:beta-fructofuranosidase
VDLAAADRAAASRSITPTDPHPMSLYLPDHWIWDFWFAQDGDDVHVFFLYAPRALGDPELRHRNARIGHALSCDLRGWELLPPALTTGPPGAFDDLATWTGSVLRHDGRWHLFYTGLSTDEDGAVQRIGLATSDDLVRWHRLDQAVLEADPRWYEKLGPDTREEAWRDPWVCWDEDSGHFHMLITARANHGPSDGRGVIGHAWSPDLRRWRAGPPLSQPGEFFHLEVPQLVHLDGLWRILFCAWPRDHSAARLARPGVVAEGGTHYLVAREKFGRYALDRDAFLVGCPQGRYYAGRLLHHKGGWHFFAWQHLDDEGRFLGALSDPMPLTVHGDGSLSVQLPVSSTAYTAHTCG